MKNMIRKIAISLLMAFTISNIVLAQQDKMKEINKIKIDKNYITVTGTSMASEEEASNNAHIMLVAEIDAWLKENSKGDVEGYTAKATKNICLIQTKIGSLYRAFAYVKKSDILPYYKDDIVITESIDADSETTVASVPPTNSSDTNTIAESSPKQESLVKTEKPVKKQNPTNRSKIENEHSSTLNNQTLAGVNVPNEEKVITKLYTAAAVKKYLASLIENDRIELYSSNITDLPQNGVAYLIIFDYHGVARKYIRVNQGIATNLSTSSSENLKDLLENNSEGYSSIWFTFK